jgi:hypothetical protein
MPYPTRNGCGRCGCLRVLLELHAAAHPGSYGNGPFGPAGPAAAYVGLCRKGPVHAAFLERGCGVDPLLLRSMKENGFPSAIPVHWLTYLREPVKRR